MNSVSTTIQQAVKEYFAIVHDGCDKMNAISKGRISANGISIFRTFVGFVALYLLSIEFYWFSQILLIISLYLDHIDGVWARRYNQTTSFGAYLDRSLDKILIVAYCVFLFSKQISTAYDGAFFMLICMESLAFAISVYHFVKEKVQVTLLVDNKASAIGKVKMILEATLLIFITLVTIDALPEIELIVVPIIYVCSLLAAASLAVHMHNMKS